MQRHVFSDAVADFAILMIAIHSALCVFNPGSRIGENGLYPYRYIAYALWVIFPILMASLAFINTYDAYVASPSSCYLPIRPYWYRLGLSWIPRYTILIAITGIYLAMNLHVRYIFKSFKSNLGVTYEEPRLTLDILADPELGYRRSPPRDIRDMAMVVDQQIRPPPRMPRLSCHGLIPPTPVTTGLPETTEGQNMNLSPSEPPKRTWRSPGNARQRWDDSQFDGTPSPGGTKARNADSDISSSRGRQGSCDDDYSEDTYSYSLPSQEAGEERQQWDRSSPRQSRRARKGPHGLTLVDSQGDDLAMRELRQTRDTIRRQLRLLFIYPLVYVLMWIIPFISHCLQFNDHFAYHPSFVLNSLVTIIVPFQCAVDCWVFSTREKPWRLIPGSKGTFWNSFLFWKHDGPECENCGFTSGPGKSRAEMVAAAREAYRRRDEELRSAAEEFKNRQRERQAGSAGKSGNERAWWEEEEGEEAGVGWRESIWRDSIIEERPEKSERPKLARLDTEGANVGRYSVGPLNDKIAP
jgi:G protein-coupled receptor GPR1